MTVVETDRLVLRKFVEGDAEFLLGLLNEPSFLRFVGDRGVRSIEEARKYMQDGPVRSYEQRGFGLYVTESKADGTPIGICGLLQRDSLEDVDIGFAFLPSFWGNGYAIEAASAVMEYARETLRLTRVVAITVADNHRSIRILEKLGMQFERTTKLGEEDAVLELYARDL